MTFVFLAHGVGMGFGAADVVTAPSREGLEYTLPESRFHFTMPDNKLHYSHTENEP